MGFDNINMDVIAGLPGSTLEDFVKTMEEIIVLGPESVTVHTMAISVRHGLMKTGKTTA